MKRHESGGAVPPRLRTSRRTPRFFVAATFVAVATLFSGGTVAAGATPPPGQAFTLSADFVGLYPGADLTVPVTAHNSQQYALIDKTAVVSVGNASPQCVAANVTAHSFSGDVTVPAGGSATIPVRMQMSAAAPDACQGATFPLGFSATGQPVGVQPPGSGFAFTGLGSGSLALAGLGTVSVLAGLALLAIRRRTFGVVAE